jgi:hypothetical protein
MTEVETQTGTMEIETEISEECVSEITEGEPQVVKIEIVVIQDTEKYGIQRTRVLSEFRSTDSGFGWANASPVRHIEDPANPNLSFNMSHIIGIEEAVEYIEQHYGEVTNDYPKLDALE